MVKTGSFGMISNRHRDGWAPSGNFQVSWLVSCGSGFPAATIEAERLPYRKQHVLADDRTPGTIAANHQTQNTKYQTRNTKH